MALQSIPSHFTLLFALPLAVLWRIMAVAHGLFFISQTYFSRMRCRNHLSLGALAGRSID
jgi:hypothetical protein